MNQRTKLLNVDESQKLNESCNLIMEPQTYVEATEGRDKAKWNEAILVEYIALIMNNTWELVLKPANANVLSSRWIFNVKYLPGNIVDKFKARLVVG